MKVIALLCFYDENPAWLSACVTGLARFCDHIVASDGGYFLFPEAKPSSGPTAHEAIIEAAYTAGIGYTLHVPQTVWYGNEVEKRNHLVQLAMQTAEPNVDWLFRVDADEFVTDVPYDIRDRLATTEFDVGGVTLWWRSSLGPNAPDEAVREFECEGAQRDMRFLIRAVPGLHVSMVHNMYIAGDGRIMYGRRDLQQEEPMDDFSDLRLEHRHHHRLRARNQRAEIFNERRDSLGVERIIGTYGERVDGEMVRLT